MAEGGMSPEQEKLGIVIREWDKINDSIRSMGDYKFRIRAWAIAVFSAIFVLAVRESEDRLFLLAIFVIALFWVFTSMHQAGQHVLFERAKEIEGVLNRMDRDEILAFHSPRTDTLIMSKGRIWRFFSISLFSIYDLCFFGSMSLFLIMSYLFL